MPKLHKILLSAYACEPNKGSEPGVGWNWAIELAKLGHEVWVITRANNKKNIESEQNLLSNLQNLHFIYYDLPNWLKFWKKGQIGVRFYYFLWQIGIVKVAKRYDKIIDFDLVHHITFGVFRQPTFLWKLNKKLIFGPLGGGETAPHRLRKSFPYKNWLIDFIRDIVNYISKFDFQLHKTLNKSDIILCKTKETLNKIPDKYKNKSIISMEIGVNDFYSKSSYDKNKFKVLYVGRFLYWKGIHLGIHAYSNLVQKFKLIDFTIIGKGHYENGLKKIESSQNIKKINWISWIKQEKLFEIYKESDCFLFPSLHDSSGNVVLEALSQGLPVICLDLGGPGQIVTNDCGRVINTKNKSEREVIDDITMALEELYNNPVLRKKLSEGALQRAKEFEWSKIVKDTYYNIEKELFADEYIADS